MTRLTVAALQLAFTDDLDANIRAVSELVREAEHDADLRRRRWRRRRPAVLLGCGQPPRARGFEDVCEPVAAA